MFAAEIRQRCVAGTRSSRWRRHIDEIFVTINGERHYLRRAMGREYENLDSFVTKPRDKKAALKFLRKSMNTLGQPGVIVTDRLRSHGAAFKKSLDPEPARHRPLAQQSREELASAVPTIRAGYGPVPIARSLQNFAVVHAPLSNHFDQERRLENRTIFK